MADSLVHQPTAAYSPPSMLKMLILDDHLSAATALTAGSICVEIISDTARSHCPRAPPPAPSASPRKQGHSPQYRRNSTGSSTSSPLPSIKSMDDNSSKDSAPNMPQHRRSLVDTSPGTPGFCRWDSSSTNGVQSTQDTNKPHQTGASRWNPLVSSSKASPPVPPMSRPTTTSIDIISRGETGDTTITTSRQRSSPPTLPKRRQTTLDIIDQAMHEAKVF